MIDNQLSFFPSHLIQGRLVFSQPAIVRCLFICVQSFILVKDAREACPRGFEMEINPDTVHIYSRGH